MAQMLPALDNDPACVAAITDWLKRMARSGQLPAEQFGGRAFSFGEDLYLAREGICGSEESVRDAVRIYLASHAATDPLSPFGRRSYD